MSRYEIRNEYSLADPELYRAADKDDPEALLEGVAMAGLVGVLRQLGDLAEFAGEIFHGLHEEVLATAARGNGLMVRVQQLEAEVPSIEKAFLSQTDHSSFFHNAGVNWHPTPQLDQNVITQGDLPRFVMDSYEECRGPPRLFLLDKFDVAGAGSCLKRYTDPSIFKVENSAMTEAAVHIEKKNRKAKRRWQRWRNGETPEVKPMSHARLHQLLLEESVENGISKPTGRVKLKRRTHFSPFASKTGNSYMEKLLKTPSPEHQMLHEVNVRSPTNDPLEADLEVLEPRSISRARETVGIKRSLPPDREEIMQKHLIYEANEVSRDDEIYEEPSFLEILKDGISSTVEDTGEKVIPVDEENKTEVYMADYQSDGVSSEIDNYVDAPSTIESGVDTDSELRVKNDFTSSSINSQELVSVDNVEHIPSLLSDSQSTGDLAISDDGNSSSKKPKLVFLSLDSPRTSAENQQLEKMPAEQISTVDIPEVASSYQKTVDEFPIGQPPKPVVFDIMCIDKDPATTSAQYDSGVVTKGTLREPKLDENGPISDDKEKKINLIMDFPCSLSVSDSNSQSGNDSMNSTPGEGLVEEPNHENAPSLSTVSDSHCHTKDSPVTISTHLLHEEDCDHKNLNDFEDTTSTLNISSVLSQSKVVNADVIHTDNSLSGELGDDDVPKLTEKDFTSKSLIEEKLDNEGLEVLSDASNHLPWIGREVTETSVTEAIDAKDHYSNSSTDNHTSSETLISSPIESFPYLLGTSLDAQDTVFIPEDETTINKLGDPKYCESVEEQRTGITFDVRANDFLVQENSTCTPESLENPEGKSDIAENNEIEQDKDVIGQEVTEMSSYEDSKYPNEVPEQLAESYSKTDHQSETGVMASSVAAAISDSYIRENVDLPVDLANSDNEHISCFDGSGLDKPENEKRSLSEGHGESGLVEEDNIYHSESNTKSGLVEQVAVHNDNLELEVSHTHPRLYLDSAADTSEVQSPLEQSLVENQVSGTTSFPVYCDAEETMLEKTELPPDRDSYPNSDLDFVVDTTQVQSPLGQSGIENQGSDATSFPVNCGTEETMLERTELSPDQIDQEFPGSGESSSELPSPLPINHQQIQDHSEHKGDENSGQPLTLVNCPLSVSGLPEIRNYDIDISGYPNKDPSGFIFPPSNPFSETSQVDLDESPPLPPLPPVQWRMGKHPQASSTTEGEIMKHQELFPQGNDTSVLLEETNHSLNQILSGSKSKEEKIEQSSSSLEDNTMQEEIHLPPNVENEQPEIAMPGPDNKATSVAEESGSANEIPAVKPPRPSNPLIESIAVLDKSKENEQPEIAMPGPDNKATSVAEESGSANETPVVKPPRPSNPLIESISVLDKSKLRKVAERVSSQIPKADERDSLLEQIRAKSFNLRPPVASRPSIQSSQTNLNVAAILEKVNAFRQAFAGSDEDDEDNWSDS